MQVSTSDGRVKLIGRYGVEATLCGGSAAPTKCLAFLRHRGALLRVSMDGSLQLFSIPGRRMLASVRIEDDVINSVAIMLGEPYILLGGESGDCWIALISNRLGTASSASAGEDSGGLDPAAGLSLQPYKSKKKSLFFCRCYVRLPFILICLKYNSVLR